MGPTFSSCEINWPLDIILLTDNSCGLSANQCNAQWGFVSDFMERVKDMFHPRFGMIEYGCNATDVHSHFSFGSQYDVDNLLLVSYIRAQTCGAAKQCTDMSAGLDAALAMFDNDGHPNRYKMLITLNNCNPHSNSIPVGDTAVCNAYTSQLRARNIETLVVNAGAAILPPRYNCFPDDPANEAFYTAQMTPTAFNQVEHLLVKEICERMAIHIHFVRIHTPIV